MLSVLFISLSKSSNILSLSKSLSPLKKLLHYYSLTLLWSYNNGTTGKKSGLVSTRKKCTWRGEFLHPAFLLYFTSLTQFRQIKLFGHKSWFLEGTRLMRKKPTQYSHRIPEGRKKEVQVCHFLFITFYLSQNSISTILLSLSLFCLFFC